MYRTEQQDTDDAYMYEFRTNRCTKTRCPNPSNCFDAHSQFMRRRVPKQGEHGLFNYIPKPCPQWQKWKMCSMGDSCLQSHGWLEIIFHPLLYKTKMCKSNHMNGVCRQYGVYCAKAHNPMEMRNLEKIYGVNWKRHYDLPMREKDTVSSSIAKSQRKCFKSFHALDAVFSETDALLDQPNSLTKRCLEQNQGRATTKTSPKLATVVDTVESPSSLFASPLLFGTCSSICGSMTDMSLGGEVTSYIQLYSETVTVSEADDSDVMFSCKSPVPQVPWNRNWYLPASAHPLQESSSSSSNSNFMSPFRGNRKIGDTNELDADWGMWM